MPTVQILDESQYTKALGLLLDMGGLFRTKPTCQLVVNPAQLRVLEKAGIVSEANEGRKRGKAKK